MSKGSRPRAPRGPASPPTGSISFRTDFHSTELQQLELPVEVRTPELQVVARKTTSQVVDGLAPGRYLVVAQLPAGQQLITEVEIPAEPGETIQVTLAPRKEEESPRETDELSHYMGQPLRTALAAPPPVPTTRVAPPVPLTGGLVAEVGAPLASGAAAPAPPPAAGRGLETLGATNMAPAPSPDTGLDFNASLIEEFGRLHRRDRSTSRSDVTVSPTAGAGVAATAAAPPATSEVRAFCLDLELQLAIFRGNALRLKAEPVRDAGLWAQVLTGPTVRFRVEGSDKGSFLQLRQLDRPPLHIALPVSPRSGCLIEICRVAAPLNPASEVDVVSVDIHVDNTDADALLRYLATGNLQNIETALAGDLTQTAGQLLSNEYEDPVAATVGGYTLLRFNRLERLARSDWTQGFFESTPWLPDSAVIHGEHLARRGEHGPALDTFLSLTERGLPVSTAGLSYVIDRLDLYLRLKESPLEPERLQAARALAALLGGFRRTILYQRQLVTFPGISPNLPSDAAPAGLQTGDATAGMLRLRFGDRGIERVVEAEAPKAAAAIETMGPADGATAATLALPPDVLASTQERFKGRKEVRESRERKVAEAPHGRRGRPGLLLIDDPTLVALRSRRLLAQPVVQQDLAEAGISPLETLGTVEDVVLERILGGDNLLGTAFLKLGALVARTVGRLVLHDRLGTSLGFGTGSLVSPRLLMTNNHVLPTREIADGSQVEFDYERGLDGRLLPISAFSLRPNDLFVTDAALDVTVVAVAEASDDGRAPLSRFGFNRLSRQIGKILIGESVNIIQHPDGRPKQVALQQNELIDRLDHFLHYRTDTAPGSSGSPVFNNQWEMIALHHSGVPKRDEQGRILTTDGRVWSPEMGESVIHWLANEGARISSILAFLESVPNLGPAQQSLLDQVLSPPLVAPEAPPVAPPVPTTSPSPAPPPARPPASPAALPARESTHPPQKPQEGSAMVTVSDMTLNLPIRISISVGTPSPVVAGAPVAPPPVTSQERLTLKKPIIDADYGSRTGYDPGFLGADLPVPLPTVTDAGVVSTLMSGGYVVPYEHFSLVLHKARRLALYTACNVDGREASRRPEPGRDYSRDGLTGLGENEMEEWVTDPRLPATDQLPDRFYSNDRGAFDKGHIVRRDDVCWGRDYAQVRRANGDTFHVTNCSPQVAGYNQSARGRDNWGDLENFVTMQARTESYCIFAGPVFLDTDRRFRGVDDQGATEVQIPRSFWKLVLARKAQELEAFAFVLEQDLDGVQLEAARTQEAIDPRLLEFRPAPEWKRRMVPIADLERRLGGLLRFPDVVHRADRHGRPEGQEIARFARLDP